MSHTAKHGNTTFHHNSDFSGDVVIYNGGENITVPIDDLRAFLGSTSKLLGEIVPLSIST